MSRSPPPPPPPPQTPPRGSCRAFRSLKSTLGWRLRHQSAPGTRARLSFSSPAPSSPLRSDARPPAPVPPSVHSAREEGRKNRARVPISESRDHPNVNHEFMPDELFITKCRSDDVWEDTGPMHLMFACQFRMSWKIARRAGRRAAGVCAQQHHHLPARPNNWQWLYPPIRRREGGGGEGRAAEAEGATTYV